MRTFAVVGCLLAISNAHAGGPTTSFSTQPYPFLGNNHVAADFNSDGNPDLAGTGGNAIAVMLNSGTGAFGPKVNFPVGGPSQDVTVGDFNNDGKIDLAVTINSPQIMLSVLTGNGNGTFNAPVNFTNTTGADSPCVIATDLNNDGKLDVIVSHEIACFTAPCTISQKLTVMLGNGDGTFGSPSDITVGTGMHRLTAGDFNRDGFKDLAICGDNTRLYILIGAGNGTFTQQPTIFLVQGGDLFSASNDVDVADFNGDGNQDLTVALPGNGRGTAILIGNGNGTFQPPFRILQNALNFPQSLAVADYNLDGADDIARAMGNGTNGLMEVIHGNGDGTFQSTLPYLVPRPQSSIGGGVIVTADFSSDGKPDIALSVVGASPALNVLLNTTPVPVCPGNIVTVGGSANQVDVDDLLAVINAWGPCSGCAADVTGDGAVDVDDLLVVINGWGDC